MSNSDLIFNWSNPAPTLNLITAKTLNIRAYKGDTINFTIDFTENTDDPLDISAYTFIFRIKRNLYDTSEIKKLTLENGLSVADNILTINTEADIPSGEYVYDLETTVDSITTTYLKGYLTLTEDV